MSRSFLTLFVVFFISANANSEDLRHKHIAETAEKAILSGYTSENAPPPNAREKKLMETARNFARSLTRQCMQKYFMCMKECGPGPGKTVDCFEIPPGTQRDICKNARLELGEFCHKQCSTKPTFTASCKSDSSNAGLDLIFN